MMGNIANISQRSWLTVAMNHCWNLSWSQLIDYISSAELSAETWRRTGIFQGAFWGGTGMSTWWQNSWKPDSVRLLRNGWALVLQRSISPANNYISWVQICEYGAGTRNIFVDFETVPLYFGSFFMRCHSGCTRKACQCLSCSSMLDAEVM